MKLKLRLYLVELVALLLLAGCVPRVYWPQGHDRRAAAPAAPSIIVLEEGRDYKGWSPAPTKCQQRPFPFHVTKK